LFVCGATASVESTAVRDTKPSAAEGVYGDGGNNACGCAAESGACKVLSAGLEPPEPLD